VKNEIDAFHGCTQASLISQAADHRLDRDAPR